MNRSEMRNLTGPWGASGMRTVSGVEDLINAGIHVYPGAVTRTFGDEAGKRYQDWTAEQTRARINSIDAKLRNVNK